MNREDIKFVAVSGYGWSGSSAVVDLLKEFKGYWNFGDEMRLLREPYGIFDLEHALVDEWDILNSDAAIKDFLWLVQRLNRKSSRWGGTGCRYGELFGPVFLDETRKYIEELTAFEFWGHWWWFEFKQSDFQMVLNRIKKRLHISDFEDLSEMRFVNVNEKQFLDITKNYLLNLYLKSAREKGVELENVILQQSISVNQFEKAARYFNDLKLIMIDRDPRDVFMDLVNGKYLIGRDIVQNHDINKFIQYFRRTREITKSYDKDRVLFLKFEDIILDYENTLNKILIFLGEHRQIHIKKFEYLKPENSKKNIGMWKGYAYQNEIRKIEQELMHGGN